MPTTPHKTPLNPKPPASPKLSVGHNKSSAPKNGAQRPPLATPPSTARAAYLRCQQLRQKYLLQKRRARITHHLAGSCIFRQLCGRPPNQRWRLPPPFSLCWMGIAQAKKNPLWRTLTLSAARCRPPTFLRRCAQRTPFAGHSFFRQLCCRPATRVGWRASPAGVIHDKKRSAARSAYRCAGQFLCRQLAAVRHTSGSAAGNGHRSRRNSNRERAIRISRKP